MDVIADVMKRLNGSVMGQFVNLLISDGIYRRHLTPELRALNRDFEYTHGAGFEKRVMLLIYPEEAEVIETRCRLDPLSGLAKFPRSRF